MVTFTEEILNGKLHFLCSDTANILIRPLKCKNVIARAFVDGVDSKNVFVGALGIFYGLD